MNRERIQDNWTRIKGRTLEKWGRFVDDGLDTDEGRSARAQLVGKNPRRHRAKGGRVDSLLDVRQPAA